MNPLGELSPDVFLRDYWQKKPLVIKRAFPNFTSPISAEELAGLSCEEGVDARIVIEKGGEHPWQAIHGPMNESIFSALPETHWTLLVNDVEKHIPALTWIVDCFRFIPEWRVDDLMISYAPEGGSVGPHMDQYDTFILQAQGHRNWKTHSGRVSESNQVESADLRVHKDFVAEHEWLLEPGDMIYIPPGVSHYGVATDDCLSFSIGFRAATHADMLESFVGYLGAGISAELTYRDPPLEVQEHPNEITPATIATVRNILDEYLQADSLALPAWFGRFISDTRADVAAENDSCFNDFDGLMATHATLFRNPASRFAFWREGNDALLFVDGDDHRVSVAFTESLCTLREVDMKTLSVFMMPHETALLLDLYNSGKLIPEI